MSYSIKIAEFEGEYFKDSKVVVDENGEDVFPFGRLGGQRISDLIQMAAEACHRANKRFCEHLGDRSQPSWDNAPDWQRQSAINGVIYHLTHPDAKPSDSHESWLKEKTEQGWVYGHIKDPEAKTHPCCVPYDQLPAAQRFKDELFIAVLKDYI